MIRPSMVITVTRLIPGGPHFGRMVHNAIDPSITSPYLIFQFVRILLNCCCQVRHLNAVFQPGSVRTRWELKALRFHKMDGFIENKDMGKLERTE